MKLLFINYRRIFFNIFIAFAHKSEKKSFVFILLYIVGEEF